MILLGSCWSLSSESRNIEKVAKLLRQSFQDNKPSLSWPPRVSELNLNEIEMSEMSYLFWNTFFNKKQLTIKELSLLHDLSFAVTKTPSAKQ